MGQRLAQATLMDASWVRVLALIVCGLSIGLVGWRATDLLTSTPPPPQTAELASLTAIAETIAGPGQVRLSEFSQADAARSLLVLVNAPISEEAALVARLEPIMTKAAALRLEAGDELHISAYPFASGYGPQLTLGALAELGALLVLAVLAGWIAILVRQPEGHHIPPHPLADNDEVATSQIDGGRRTRLTVLPVSPLIEKAGDVAASDPKRLADTLRNWMAEDRPLS